MSVHLSKRQVERYLKKSMSPVELLDIDEHVSTCRDCHAQLYGTDAVLRAYTSIVSDLNKDAHEISEHLTEKELPSGLHSPASKRRLWNRLLPYAAAVLAVVFMLVWISFKYMENSWPPDQQDRGSGDDKVSEPADSQNLSSETHHKQEKGPSDESTAENTSKPDDSYKSARKGNYQTLTSKYKDVVEAAMAGELVLPPVLQKLQGKAGNLMSGSVQEASFPQIYPVGEVIESVRPVFRWEPLRGVSAYVVTVFDPGYNEVAISESIESTEWTMPRALERGVIYSWMLSAKKDGQIIRIPAPSQPEARFKILSRSEAEELERERKKYPGNHLLLGAIYARSGLLNEAELEFSRLLKADPDSQIARKLLERVRTINRKAR